MPRLSLDARLDRLLAESMDSTRYTDLAIVARRLTLTPHVPPDTRLTDAAGRVWVAAHIADDGHQPVRSEDLWASTSAADGTLLSWSDGVAVLEAAVVISCGGVWDHLRKTWKLDASGERVAAADPVIVDLQESQLDAMYWFQGRLAAFRNRQDHPHFAGLLFDDRRGGKTFIAGFMLLCALVDVPAVDGMPLEAWLVTQTLAARDEIEETLDKIARPGWYKKREAPKRQFIFCHGAKLSCKTSDDVETLRVGRCDFGLINEAALLPEAAYNIVGRATQDKQGCLLLTTNSPRSLSNAARRRRGGWVARVWDGAERDEKEGNEPVVKLLRCSPEKNMAVKQEAKAKILRGLAYARDPDAPDLTDEGIVAESGETVCSWDDDKHIRPLPQLGVVDVTEEVTRRLYNRPFGMVIGGDFQTECAASAFKFFAPAGDLSQVQIWSTHAWFMAGGGDESDLSEAIVADGVLPGSALWVADNSGMWQSGTHGYGPVSYAALRRLGWEVTGVTLKKTDKASYPKNPDVAQSTSRLRKFIAEDRFFCTPTAKVLSLSLKKCEARRDAFGNIRPKANTRYSHNLDTARYIAWWLTCRPEFLTAGQKPAYVTAARR